mgnify:CR=1 FL=1
MPLDPRLFEEILYDGLISLENQQDRAAFLDQVCSDNPELRNRLEKLAALHDKAESFFDFVLELDCSQIIDS